jgi:hypothetical protein
LKIRPLADPAFQAALRGAVDLVFAPFEKVAPAILAGGINAFTGSGFSGHTELYGKALTH